jgi:tRNA-splicing ligase RtcB
MKPHVIFSDSIDGKALAQFYDSLAQPYAVKGALMPDAHAGYALPIGGVIATDGHIVPAWVGFDIGCGMCALETTLDATAIQDHKIDIFNTIYKEVPTGHAHNSHASQWTDGDALPKTKALYEILAKKGTSDLHSLGTGNHFIEIGEDERGKIWIIVHSGSRHVGHSVASHYMRLAAGGDKAREGHYPLLTDSRDGKDYLTDMAFCLEYALENRRGIIERVLKAINKSGIVGTGDWKNLINRNHNHAEEKDGLWITRKGATHAEDGMMGVVPGSMRDGSFIVRGKGNPDSLYSSSHGAGRVLARGEAKRSLDLQVFRDEMDARGIQAKVCAETLDESAAAYKNIFEVMAWQKDLVDVVHHVKPLINIKA